MAIKNRGRTPSPKPVSSPGTAVLPRWLQILAALVPAAALIWGGITYFVPAVKAPAPSAPPVTASAPGAIAVGNMGGGTINGANVGVPTAGPRP